MASPQLQNLVESAQLKLASYVLTMLMIPACLWFGNRVLADMDTLKSNQQIAAIKQAEMSLRVEALEKAGVSRAAAIEIIREQTIRHEYELRRLMDERLKEPRK